MSLLLKDPLAALDYGVDWASDYLDGEGLTESGWTVDPDEPGGIAVDSHRFDDFGTSVSVSGGHPGHVYRLINRVVTSSGRTDARSIVLRVEAR
nr:hypothetical protein [uncultured Sphingomonas sp.]